LEELFGIERDFLEFLFHGICGLGGDVLPSCRML
jgi:hypothetical protein